MIPKNIGDKKLISVIYVDPNSELKFMFSETYDYKEALKMRSYNNRYLIVGYSYYGVTNPKDIEDISTNEKEIYYTDKKGVIQSYIKLPIKRK